MHSMSCPGNHSISSTFSTTALSLPLLEKSGNLAWDLSYLAHPWPNSSILNPPSLILHPTFYILHSPFSILLLQTPAHLPLLRRWHRLRPHLPPHREAFGLLLTFHSFGGGTDSALTSLLIERLSGRLRHKVQAGVCHLRGPPSGHRWGGALPPTKHPYHLLHHPCHLPPPMPTSPTPLPPTPPLLPTTPPPLKPTPPPLPPTPTPLPPTPPPLPPIPPSRTPTPPPLPTTPPPLPPTPQSRPPSPTPLHPEILAPSSVHFYSNSSHSQLSLCSSPSQTVRDPASPRQSVTKPTRQSQKQQTRTIKV